MKPFQKARLKLTLWYILISVFLLFVFSVAAITAEQRAFQRIEQALSDRVQRPRLTTLLATRIAEFERDFQKKLFFFDAFLLIAASAASYFLSGVTLKPIEEMLTSQEDFAADASHELRTPLATIGIEIEALKRTEKKIPPLYNHVFHSINQEIQRMRGMVDGLLTLVRVDTEKEKAHWDVFDISELTSLSVRQMQQLAKRKKIAMRITQSKKIGVQGNRDQIKQVILILLDNAITYTPRGGHIEVSIIPSRGKVVLTVSDTGCGIPEKEMPFIFNRFYQVEQQDTSERGTGLGLAIAKKIIENHKGNIRVESKEGEGSRFIVSFDS